MLQLFSMFDQPLMLILILLLIAACMSVSVWLYLLIYRRFVLHSNQQTTFSEAFEISKKLVVITVAAEFVLTILF